MEDQPSSSSSSLGECSWTLEDKSGTAEEDGEEEVQSSFEGPLDQMSSLEDSLPVKRGLSEFYNGKSRSFTCLLDAMNAKDIVKPEDTYARKLKILRAHSSSSLDKHRSCQIQTLSAEISKKSSYSNPGYLKSVAEANTELESQDVVYMSFATKKAISMTDIQAAGYHPPS